MTVGNEIGFEPVQKKERIEVLDITRGFALFGVLMVNMMMFNNTFFAEVFGNSALSDPLGHGGVLDKASSMIAVLLAEGKFYTIFSFLFGIGFHIFMERAKSKGLSPKRMMTKRLSFLMIFGGIHYSLVWYGDILHVYAVCGFFLLLFRNKSSESIRKWAVGLIMASMFLSAGLMVLDESSSVLMGQEAYAVQASSYESMIEESKGIYSGSSYMEAVSYRISKEFPYRLMGLVFQVPKILGLFLVGLYAGRTGFFTGGSGSEKRIDRVFRISGTFSIVLAALHMMVVFSSLPDFGIFSGAFETVVSELSGVSLASFYVSSIAKLQSHGLMSKHLGPVAKMGRMALSNYIMQCVICSLIFYGHGLGLMDGVGSFFCLSAAVFIYIIQAASSVKYLQRFEYGPLEYIWRRLTYKNAMRTGGQL